MNKNEIIGGTIIDAELSYDDISSILIKKDNYNIRLCGTDEYPFIMCYVESVICFKCGEKMAYEPSSKKHGKYGYICKKCGTVG